MVSGGMAVLEGSGRQECGELSFSATARRIWAASVILDAHDRKGALGNGCGVGRGTVGDKGLVVLMV